MSHENIEPDQVSASIPESPGSSAPTGQAARRSGWQSARDALDYLSKAEKERRGKSRKSDAMSSAVLGCAIVGAGISPFLPGTAGAILLAIDVILICCVVYYGVNRLGVLTALPPDKAAIAGELLLAATIFGFCLAANLFGLVALLSYATAAASH
jgi:hypothetical protein